jgi:hypothetical protein
LFHTGRQPAISGNVQSLGVKNAVNQNGKISRRLI